MQTPRSNRELIKFVRDYKTNNPCMDCKTLYHYSAMQFDHRDGSEKTSTINRLMWRASIATVKEEIAKCDLVCANCHAKRTFKRHHNIAYNI